MSVRNLVKDFETKLSPTSVKASPRILPARKTARNSQTSATSISSKNRFDWNQDGDRGNRSLQSDAFSTSSHQRGIYEPKGRNQSKCMDVGKVSKAIGKTLARSSLYDSISFGLDEDLSNKKKDSSSFKDALRNRLKNDQMGGDEKTSRQSITPNFIDEKESEEMALSVKTPSMILPHSKSSETDVGVKRKLLIEGLKQHLNDSKFGLPEEEHEHEKSSNENNRCTYDVIDRSYDEDDEFSSSCLHCTNKSLEEIDDEFGISTRVDVERQTKISICEEGNVDFIENHCSIDSVESIDSLVQHCKFDISPQLPPQHFALDHAKLDDDESGKSIELEMDGAHPNIRRHRSSNCHQHMDFDKKVKNISTTCRSSIVIVRKLMEKTYEKSLLLWWHFTSFVFDTSVYVQRIPKAMKITAKCVVEVTRQPSLSSFLGLCIVMFTCIDTTTPRCNPALGMLMFTHASQVDQSREFYRFIIFIVLISIAVDIDWLTSDYYPLTLDSNTDSFNYRSTKETLMSVSWYLVLIGSLFKLSSLITILFHSPNGRTIVQGIWNKLQVFLPPRRLSSVPGDIESRVIAILWLELISSISFFLLAIYVQTQLSWAPHFSTPILFTSITNLIYLKALFGLLLVIAILRNTKLSLLCSELNCFMGTSVDQHYHKVRIDKQFLCFNGGLKSLSSTIGGFLWVWLAFAVKLGTNKEVCFVLGAMFITLSITDIISTLNGIVVVYSYYSIKPETRDEIITHIAEVPGNDDRCVEFDIALDPSPAALNPGEFSLLWKSCSKVESVRYTVLRAPTMQECINIFEQNKFHPVAFGLLGSSKVMKIFLFAKSSSTRETRSYLVEIIFDPIAMMVNVQTKATVSSSAQAFHYLLFAPLKAIFKIENPDIISKVNFHHDNI